LVLSSWGVFSRSGSVAESGIVASIRFSLDLPVSALKVLLFIAFEAILVDRMNHTCRVTKFRRISVHSITKNITFGEREQHQATRAPGID
jgi:hypothetical protein